MENKIEIGKEYKMADIDVICVGYTKKGHAKIQMLGIASGVWPGDGDISNYNGATRKFTSEWEGVIKKFKLPSKKQAEKNELIKDALAKAAYNYRSLGATYCGVWLGTTNGNGFAQCVGSNETVYRSISYSSWFVIAPQFNLDTSRIILDGDEIKKNRSKLTEYTRKEAINIIKTEKNFACDEKYAEADAISRQKVKELYYKNGYIDFRKVCELPSVTSQSKTGHWTVKEIRGSIRPYCSVCGDGVDTIFHYRYCPNCGAKMVVLLESEDKE